MLPQGFTADLASFSDQQALKSLHPDAQTVARILSGRCSCDLVRSRLPDRREDERYLRERYRSLGVPRSATIAALERHRRTLGLRSGGRSGPRELSQFVAEHARNAGPSLYHLDFSPQAAPLAKLDAVRHVTVPLVSATPEGWLAEGTPTLVAR